MNHSLNPAVPRLRSIIAEKCILRGNEQWLISPDGAPCGWLIDMRQAFLDAEALDLCSDIFWDRFAPLLPFQLGGLEIAAIPLVTALLIKARQRGLDVTGFILRKERKSYGVGKVLEGRIGPEPIFIVDDIMNSAESLEKARVIIESLKRRIDHVFIVVNFESPIGLEWAESHGIKPNFLYTLQDFGLTNGRAQRSYPPKCFETIWSFTSDKANHFHVVPKSAPVVSNGKVIFGSDRGTLWALDVQSGEIRWSFQIRDPGRKGIWSRPAVNAGRVYFGGYDGNLYCLDAESGREIWSNGDADWIGSSPALDPSQGLLWIGLEHARPDAQGSVAAFDMESGEKRWEQYFADYVHGTPAFSQHFNAVAIGGNDRKLRLLDALTGEIRWEFATEGSVKEAPLFDEGRKLVYFAGFDGNIRALDVETGSQVWAIETGNMIYSTPLRVRDHLFVTGTDKNLHVIDLANAKHEFIPLGSKSVSSPVEIGGSIFFGTNSGAIHELDARGEKGLGRHYLPEPVTNRLAYCPETRTFFGLTYMNQIYAFRRIGE